MFIEKIITHTPPNLDMTSGSVLIRLLSHKSNRMGWGLPFSRRILLGDGRVGAKVGEFHRARAGPHQDLQ